MLSPFHRAHEYLAERFRWVQFPKQQYLPRRREKPFFKTAMPLHIRFGLVVFAAAALLAAVGALFLVGLLAWAALTA